MKNFSIYIILTKTDTLFAKSIRKCTNSSYSHTSISLNIDKDLMYSFGRKNPKNPFVGGFVEEHSTTGVFGMQRQLPCVILEIKVTKKEYNDISKHIHYFKCSKDDFKYNLKGLFWNRIHREHIYDNKFFCSEFVYHLISTSIVLKNPICRTFVEPDTFLTLDECTLIYEGDLKTFFKKKHKYAL